MNDGEEIRVHTFRLDGAFFVRLIVLYMSAPVSG